MGGGVKDDGTDEVNLSWLTRIIDGGKGDSLIMVKTR
jgi:hypothetical protein